VAKLKKRIKHYIQLNVLPFIIQLIVRFIYLSNKKVFHHPEKSDNEPFILAMWHGDLLMQAFNYRVLKPHGEVKVIVSEHRDGETIRKVVSYLGVGGLQGSSTRGGAKALIGAIKAIKKGTDVAITPDGPQGPIYSIADGIVLLAQKTNSKIICCASKPTKYWEFNSWDKFKVPKPFGKIDFYTSEAIDISNLELEDAKILIKTKLEELYE
jgi:lysophospholipid acyltransferase (LPLAT)-like uncharacterized protein